MILLHTTACRILRASIAMRPGGGPATDAAACPPAPLERAPRTRCSRPSRSQRADAYTPRSCSRCSTTTGCCWSSSAVRNHSISVDFPAPSRPEKVISMLRGVLLGLAVPSSLLVRQPDAEQDACGRVVGDNPMPRMYLGGVA